MGTRNLTMVILDKEIKVAQYGQWDGYPDGQGATILEVLLRCDLDTLKEKIKALRWLTKEEIEEIDKADDWDEIFPYLSRNTGGQILRAIYDGQLEVNDGVTGKKVVKVDILGLVNQEEFAKDSLFCEWAYVIDLDKNTFEIYKGFNEKPLTSDDRFYYDNYKNDRNGYYPIKLLKSYSLTNLSSGEEIINELNELTKEIEKEEK